MNYPRHIKKLERNAHTTAHKYVAPASQRYTFWECINGTAPAPTTAAEKSIFQLLMIVGMAAVMSTFNGMRHSGLDFFFESHWLYPVVLCITLCLRLGFVNRLVDYVIPRFIAPHFAGFPRNAAITLLNTAIMSPIMGCAVTLLLNGTGNFTANLLGTLTVSAPFAILMSLLVVGPAVRYLYHNVVTPVFGVSMLNDLQRHVTGVAGFFTS